MKMFNKVSLVVLASAFILSASSVFAATSVGLGAADNFAVLAGSAVTNTGSSVITGDLGLSPGTSVTGIPPGTVNGTQHVADATSVQAKTDLTNAYNNAAGQTPVSVVPTELGGTTLTTGAYSSAAGTFGITGTLTLDAQGNPNAVFIFKTASTLITGGASNVVLVNGAQACNVYWQVGSSATLGANSIFRGNILAASSITLTTGANVQGRVLAQTGAVTLDTATVTRATCAVPPPVVVPPVVVPPVVVPPPVPVVVPAPVPVTTVTTTVAPTLPVTGFAPENGISFGIVILALVSIGLFSFYLTRKERVI